MPVSDVRHRNLFDRDAFVGAGLSIDIIGCGSVGSRIAFEIGKLGLSARVFDPDIVSEENLGNQLYGPEDLGKLKVSALQKLLRRQADVRFEVMPRAVTRTDHLSPIVFTPVDSMSVRWDIWDGCVKLNPYIQLMIDPRMGRDYGRILRVRPRNDTDIERYENGGYPDEVADDLVCGEKTNVGYVASVLACLAVSAMVRWFKFYQGNGSVPEYELDFGLQPPEVKAFW